MKIITVLLYLVLVMCIIQAWRLTFDSNDELSILVLTVETAVTAILGAILVASFF